MKFWVVFKHILEDDIYFNTTFGFLKEKYFDNTTERKLFDLISKYVKKYHKKPTYKELRLKLQEFENEEDYTKIPAYIEKLEEKEKQDNIEFLLNETEEFIKGLDLRLSVLESAEILSTKPDKKDSIRGLIEDSMKISFDQTVGHDYIDDYEKRYEYYSCSETAFPCDLEVFNKITKDGFKKRSLSLFLAQPHLGKCRPGDQKIRIYVSKEMKEDIENCIVDEYNETLYEIDISLEDLFNYLEINNDKYEELQTSDKEIFVKTPTGDLTPILGYVKKENNLILKVELEDGTIIRTSNKHIISENGIETLVKDADEIDTINGTVKIVSKQNDGIEDVYDISIADPHWYICPDGIIHHNTMMMTHLASSFLTKGFNVLYITLEMREEEIAKRIDSNLLGIPIWSFDKLDKEEYIKVAKGILKNGLGKLIIKEYPTGAADIFSFKALVEELRNKKEIKPDIILVDYVGIMRALKNGNMYESLKKNSEDLRQIAVQEDCVVISAIQSNRGSFDKMDGVSMADMAESVGPAHIADAIFGISKFETGAEEENKEEQEQKIKTSRQIMISVIKNRFGGLALEKFVLKQDFKYMRVIDERAGNTTSNSSNQSVEMEYGNIGDLNINNGAKEVMNNIFNFEET